ncbi:AAA family ATPase [Cellulomonas sp. CW35]|uniref:AAA family ATPase n=1 Tax=Cellulomonas sp. CW35 TaxID=3458249 RepID=UPI004034CA8D
MVVYGDTGVGKSSLLRYAAEDENMDTVVVECMSSKSYTDLLEDALRKLIDVKEIRRSKSSSTSGSAELGGTLKLLVTVKGTLTGARGKSSGLMHE